MGFDGAAPHEQPGGDLRVGAARGDQVGHLLLGRGQDRAGSGWGRGAGAHPGEFAEDAALPPRGTEPLEDHQRGLEEIEGLPLVPRPPVDLPGGKQRPRFLERHRETPVRLKSGFQRRCGAVEVAAGGEQQPPAPCGGGNAPSPAQLG